jgi:hypothetical protein
MSSTDLLPKDPSNTSGINQPAYETLRYNFLNRFINTPNMYVTIKTVADYLNSAMIPDNYQFMYVSKQWKKNGNINAFAEHDLITLMLDPEQASFRRDCCDVILKDITYCIGLQQAIIDNEASTNEQRIAAMEAKGQLKAKYNRLFEYCIQFSNATIYNAELIILLKHFLSVNE